MTVMGQILHIDKWIELCLKVQKPILNTILITITFAYMISHMREFNTTLFSPLLILLEQILNPDQLKRNPMSLSLRATSVKLLLMHFFHVY